MGRGGICTEALRLEKYFSLSYNSYYMYSFVGKRCFTDSDAFLVLFLFCPWFLLCLRLGGFFLVLCSFSLPHGLYWWKQIAAGCKWSKCRLTTLLRSC